MSILRAWIVATLALFGAGAASADDVFAAGRPGNTDSAIAVAPGRWQIETEIASYASGEDADTLSLAQTTLRYGVAANWDVELIVAPYTRVAPDNGEAIDGFGDVTLRARRTLQNSDEGALGVIAYVTAPTAEDGLGAAEVEGGIELAGENNIGARWSLAWTVGAGAQSNDEGGYEARVFGGAGLSYAVNAAWGVYAEAFADHAADATEAVLQTGATRALGENAQLDFGAEFGLSDGADDVRAFIGWAWRI